MTRLLAGLMFLLASTALSRGQEKDRKVEIDPKNNIKEKVFGKWKIVAAPGFDEKMVKQLETIKAYAYIEFTPEGTVNISVESEDPEFQKLIAGAANTKVSCKYRLLAGDTLEVFGLPKELKTGGPFGNKETAKTTVTLDKDDLTMTDEDKQTVKLRRIKETKAKDAPPKP